MIPGCFPWARRFFLSVVLGSLRSGREQVVDPDPGSEPSDIAGISRLFEIGSKVLVGRYSFAETMVEARPLIGETLAPSGSESETAVSV